MKRAKDLLEQNEILAKEKRALQAKIEEGTDCARVWAEDQGQERSPSSKVRLR